VSKPGEYGIEGAPSWLRWRPSILGADEASFDEYDRAIRVEYEWAPEDAYRAARTNVLQGFLKRERIFQTAAYRSKEGVARRNIERALERLL
jgi:predicted metal-dependent HD superfamily phosphohydrolase